MKAVSIIIPAYNAERTIEECLSAIHNLDWDVEIEVIVVDDTASTDSTVKIAQCFPGVKIIPVPHGGASQATNIGIKAATHDIVVSVDSHAILEKDWLNKAIPLFDNPNVAAVSGYVQGHNRKLISKINGYHIELRHQRRPWYVDAMGSANTAYRREAIIKVGMIHERMNIGYDHDIALVAVYVQRLTQHIQRFLPPRGLPHRRFLPGYQSHKPAGSVLLLSKAPDSETG